ncbi:MAG TPA: flagellar biosynthesis anti-sigma factor FlgM [Dyella sp.]|nr:flagellar biosynthesis anti-sigma factor FlgM [Dyella sp.]
MNTTISNNGLPKLPQTGVSQGSGTQTGAPAASGPSDAAGTTAGVDKVNLTDSARALAEASRSGDASPIDTAKVERIRQALASGTYQVNPERIADGMLSMEQQMAGTKPVAGDA